ncbi:MAG: hypothetical protein CSA11_11035 [Chloroflexi bacterium]|nr:MAG: hypothetical protein CSA11_11035 [Chloroflexota bacterium]
MEPVPIDKDANDWYADQEGIQFFSSMISEHPNGLGVMVQTLYKHKYDDYHSTFFVEEEFIAEISIASGLPETKPFAIICLLDYQQIPCHPDLPKEYILEISKDSFPSTRIPIHITDLQPGLHDLNVVIVRNPYEEGIDAIGENIRYSILTTVGSYNLLKDGVVESANTIKPIRVEPEGRLDRPAILDVSTNPQLVNELGNIPLWIDAQGKVGEILPFFLHFNSDVYDEQGDTIAVTAFLNYEQVPLLYEGEEYLSFYVVREADSWQRASVSIQLPYEPGIYELFVVARTDAFSPLEIEHSERDLVGSETSKRIRIEVIP